jgi:hypothetical protein
MSDEYHALASPSGAHRWLYCANSLAMEDGQPQGDTKAADLGTDKHELLALCMEFGKNAMDYEGHVLKKGHTVNRELATDVQTVLDNVRERIKNHELMGCTVQIELEQDVPIDHITGEEGATGRADIVLIVSRGGSATLDVIDAKFGYQEVETFDNPQLLMYAAGALEKFGLTEEFDKIFLCVEQPLRGLVLDTLVGPDDVAEFAADASQRAAKAIMVHRMRGERALKEEDFAPGEKTCQWCKAKAVCPAVLKVVEESFMPLSDCDDPAGGDASEMVQHLSIEDLGDTFPKLELIEDWIKAVRARIELEVFAGRKVPGVKVVAGKRGNRAWSSDEEAEQMLKDFRVKVDQMYSFKLLGPKPILELLKDQPRRLKKIEQLVVQPDGKPHVVLESDKRPAIEIKPVEDGFETVDDLC